MKIKKLNKKRKMLLSFTTIVSIAAPITTIVSCGSMSAPNNKEEGNIKPIVQEVDSFDASGFLSGMTAEFTSTSMTFSKSAPAEMLFEYSVDNAKTWSRIIPNSFSPKEIVHVRLVWSNQTNKKEISGFNDKAFVVSITPTTQTPTTPMVQQPTTPVVQQPTAPAVQQPTIPVVQQTTPIVQPPQRVLHERNASAAALTVDRFPVLQKHTELLTNPKILSFLKDWNDIVGGIDNLDASLDVAYLNNIQDVLAKHSELPTITTSFGAGDVGGKFAFVGSLLRVGIPGHFISFGAGAYDLATAMGWFNNMFLKLCPNILSKADILETIDVSSIPIFVENQDYEVGVKVLYKGKLWKLLQAYRGATDSNEYNIEEEYGPGGEHALWKEIEANLINMPSGVEIAKAAVPFVLGDNYDKDDVVSYQGKYYRAVKYYVGTWSEDEQNLPGGPHTGTGAPDDEWEEVSNPTASVND